MEESCQPVSEPENSGATVPTYSSFGGWALQDCLAIDAKEPGFMGGVLRASPARRQVIFSVLAAGALQDPAHFRDRILEAAGLLGQAEPRCGELGELLLLASKRSLAHAAFGDLPQGLLATLVRVGARPLLKRESYAQLGWFFLGHCDAKRTRAVQYQTRVSDETLHRLERLNPVFVHPKFQYGQWRFGPEVDDLNAVVDLLKRFSTNLSDAELASEIGRLHDLRDLPSVLSRWFGRADRLPPPPVPGDEEVTPLRTGPELVDAGREFRNCLASKILDVARGHVYYYARRVSPVGVAAVHRLCDGRWILGGIHATNNALVGPELAQTFQRAFAGWGIPYLARFDPQPEWGAARAVLRHHPFGNADFAFLEFEEAVA